MPVTRTSPEEDEAQDVFDRALIYVIISLFVLWIAVGVWYLVKTIRAENSPLVYNFISSLRKKVMKFCSLLSKAFPFFSGQRTDRGFGGEFPLGPHFEPGEGFVVVDVDEVSEPRVEEHQLSVTELANHLIRNFMRHRLISDYRFGNIFTSTSKNHFDSM